MLNIQQTNENDQVIITLEGEMDTVSTPVLEKEIKDSIETAKEIVFDFEKLTYISSAGLRLLLSIQKKKSQTGHMKLLHVSDSIMEVFEMTGFDSILTIE